MRFNDQRINLPSLNNVINRSPLTISPDSFVVEAIVLMSQERCSNYALTSLNPSLDLSSRSQPSTGCVLVLEAAYLLGIFTDEDVLRLIASGMDLSTVTMAEVMTQPVVTLRQSDSQDIFIALSLLRQHQTHYLPVLDDRGQLLGIITETSLLQAFDLIKMVGVVEGLQQYLQKPTDEFKRVNQPIEIDQVRCQTQNNLKLWVEAQSAEIMQVNQELQQALEELQVVEEELRQQNEELAVARELVELERQRYQDLFEFAPDAYLVTDVAGIIQEANKAAATLLAVEQKYLVNKPLNLFIAQEDRQTFTTRRNNSQQVQEWEIYLKPRGGTAFPVSIRAAAMYDSEGKEVGWRWLLCNISERQQAKESLHQAYDELEKRVAERTAELVMSNVLLQQEITERQRAEVALRQSENLYRQLVESQTDIIIRIDLQFQITFANMAACQTFGWKQDEFRSQSFFQFLHPDDLPEVMEDMTTLGSSFDALTNRERRAFTVNGIRWFQWSAIAIRDYKGEVIEIQGVGRDITEQQAALHERQLAEVALRQSEEKFRNFAENTHAIITIASPDSFHPLYISPAYETIWGRSCQSLYDQPDSWLDAIHPDDRDRATQSIEQLLNTKSSSVEYRILRPDGSMHWIWNRGFAVYDEQGKVDYYGCIAEDITERKLAEESLRQSEEKFRNFAENTHAMIWIGSADSFEPLYISPSYEKIWGRSSQGLFEQPKSWVDTVHPDDRDRATQSIEQLLSGSQSISAEYRILRPDGSVRWIWNRGFAVYDHQGKVNYYGGIAEDITERKLSEESLKESEARLSLALEAGQMGIWDRNLIANTSIWSPNMGPLYGLPSNTLCPTVEDYLNLVHPEDRESVAASIPRMIEEGRATTDYRVVWPDGSLHWLNCKAQVYYNEIGQMIRMIGTNRDVTERKLAEQKISEQAALLDIATDAILVRDFQSQILFWNKGAERMYGWLSTEVIGKYLQEILYLAGTQQQLEVALKSVIESGSWQGELCKVTKSGQKIVVESRWTLMRDPAGEPKSILTVDTDITEKKQLQEQFYRTQRLESLGTLAGGIAHDLNNILTPILAAAQLVQGEFLQDEERSGQLLALVETNAKRGAALVKQVLSFARGFKGERTIIQIKYLISEIIQIAKQTFPKSIEFYTVVPEDIWAITGDTTQLHQVLMNLVVNARDALPDGGNIKISAENKLIDETYTRMNIDAKVGHSIVITVADNGIGIPPEILDRIFEPFFTTKAVNKGTGLGLSTVLGIIRSHDGFIKVSSNVGKGSKFDLFLPAVEATQLFRIEDLDMLPGQGELILVVDDEAQIREIATIILENHNYKILAASNGIEAIALYAQYKHQINAVLMDIMMPEMDGITAIRTLQKMNTQVQIIACSGLNSMEVFAQAAHANVQAVLSKPYTARELLKSLHQLFRG
ncbi:MAG: PAS domain S-box protein [Nostoc sp. NOS(2021)]|uniref:PAS domain S-box protein n=1 Tax=Nostoc sp. NOS(2021) TaxID=2815407 RepID=UPI0025CC5138|nr:PAS domain S-box protein [Nostoc sp. NOS(2021)]MBN3896914.1 PAS domain S-box protein [Nostoc sp. NOS(2021)]